MSPKQKDQKVEVKTGKPNSVVDARIHYCVEKEAKPGGGETPFISPLVWFSLEKQGSGGNIITARSGKIKPKHLEFSPLPMKKIAGLAPFFNQKCLQTKEMGNKHFPHSHFHDQTTPFKGMFVCMRGKVERSKGLN